ncbi:MAG: glycosyltransferase [Magnetococcus sp. WYHC-3]
MTTVAVAPAISVLIPSFNGREELLRCLKRLACQSLPPGEFEVVVTLDGSTDGSRDALRRLALPLALQVIEQPNRGRAAALNAAAARAGGDYLVVIDGDIQVNEDFLAAHRRTLQEADISVGPIPMDPSSPVNYVTDPVGEWGVQHARHMASSGGPRRCSQFFGANMAFRAEVFRELGGYREDFLRTEDWELGRRILARGCRVAWCPGAVAAQVFDKSIAALFRDTELAGAAQARFAREFPEVRGELRLARWGEVTPFKRWLRPRVMARTPLGRGTLALIKLVLEGARRAGCRGRFWRELLGASRDAVYFRGVQDALGDAAAFRHLVAAEPVP